MARPDGRPRRVASGPPSDESPRKDDPTGRVGGGGREDFDPSTKLKGYCGRMQLFRTTSPARPAQKHFRRNR